MRMLTWLLSLPVFAAVIVFVLQNRMIVSLSFWPFDAELALPVSILSLALLLIGFVLGAMVASLATLRAMRDARRFKREAASLDAKLKAQPTATVAVPASFIGGTYKTVPPLPPVVKVRPSFFKRLLSKGK